MEAKVRGCWCRSKVDAVILEYYLGLLDGAAVADEIKKVRPRLPIIMLAESLELPEGALKSVDALVTNGVGPRFLLEAIHTVLQAKDRLPPETLDDETLARAVANITRRHEMRSFLGTNRRPEADLSIVVQRG